MVEFIAFDPNVETKGAAVLATLAALQSDASAILHRHGITEVDADAWYPQQACLDALKEISRMPELGTLGLVIIGIRIPELADWPDDITSTTVEDALNSINTAYQMNHRNGDIGYYHAERVDDTLIRVTCENPYPSDFDYGIIYGVVKRYAPSGVSFQVTRAPFPSRLNGDDMCVYKVIFE
ncbi:MAG: hypothetical protein K8S97_04415 [Anaerolineae bacterium]|nr:hypothetical protein [Anaerolineae bacterium]